MASTESFDPVHLLLCLRKKRPCLSIAPSSQIIMWLGGPVVLLEQFVGAVVLEGDGGASPGDGNYVPIVVVGVFIFVVVAIPLVG